MEFKKTYSFKDRYNESQKIITKYPDRIPIICERSHKYFDLPNLDKKKISRTKDSYFWTIYLYY